MDDYIDMNLKNTKYLMSKNTPERYNRLRKNRYEVQLSIFEKYVDKSEPLLDIGIREGAFLEFLKEKGFKKLYGVDIYKEGVDMAIEKGFPCVVADAHMLNLKKKFSTITMSHVLEHCPYPDRVLECVYDHLIDGGILFIETPREEGDPVPTEKDAHYSNFGTMESLLSLFDDRWEVLENLVQGNRGCRLKIVVKKRGA